MAKQAVGSQSGEKSAKTTTVIGSPEDGKRGRAFYRFVRRRVANELAKRTGMDIGDAREEVATMTNAEIDNQADLRGVGALGDGTFLQWLIDHKDQIIQLIMAIVSILAMFGGPEDDEEEDEEE